MVDELIDKKGLMGEYDPDGMTIEVVKKGLTKQGIKISEDKQSHTFCHELGHAFANIFGYDKLLNDEKFCDDFGYFLKQILEQMK